MTTTLSVETISTKLKRIAELSREEPKLVWTTLAHHIDVAFLKEAYQRTRKDGAVGIDKQTAIDYATDLDNNLESLCNRFKSGQYKAPPVKRCLIPKSDGSQRPIGIPTFEDKVLQRAVVMLLEAIYEQDFLNCSYGFRPKRNAHRALTDLREGLMQMKGGVVIEVDIENYFDTIDHTQLRRWLDKRVRDGVIRRMIDKWLKAGVMEKGNWSQTKAGTPQGGVISPLLANIYLHHVVDIWFNQMVTPCLNGRGILIRYADDMIMAFNSETDAMRVMQALPKRLAKYGLTLNIRKTRRIRFNKPSYRNPNQSKPETFTFLGFTHYWGKTRKGYWVIKWKTDKKRLNRSLKAINQWCKQYRHRSLSWQQKQLIMKLKGHQAYYGITGNARSLERYRDGVRTIWRKWLSRRSQRARITWEKYETLLKRFPLPRMRVIHSTYVS
jgi:RNA-directed DNA polymerase